jgi:hypothetical protein
MIEKDLVRKVIEQERDFTVRTPPTTIEEFMTGSIHQDFLNELALRIEQMRDFYENCDSKGYLETRGGIRALRLVSGIFHDLHQNALNQQEETKDGR